MRKVREAGDVGEWSRRQMGLLTMQQLVVYDVEPEVEYMFLDSAFATDGGLRTILEIMHLTLTKPTWDEQALERVKDIYRMFQINTNKNIELLTHDTINAVIYEDRRIMDPNKEALQALTLDGVRDMIEAQFASGALELNIVGDIMLVLGKLVVALGSGTIAFLMLDADTFNYGDEKVSSPLFIVIVVVLFAFIIANVFMSIVELGIDTILLCYCKDCDDNNGAPVNAPPALVKTLGMSRKIAKMKAEEAAARDERAGQ